MNYIKQLNAVFTQFYKDSRLNPTHVSLYMALFHFGNLNRFPEVFYINREEVMKLSKIGSKGTYHKCLKDLNHWCYIKYLPSHNPYKGSKISLLIFETSTEQQSRQASEPVLKHSKSNTNNLNVKKEEVLNFLKSEFQKSMSENNIIAAAEKFYNHNQATGWIMGGKTPIKDWKFAARNWVLKALEIEKNTTNMRKPRQNHLKTERNKDYDTPL